MRRLAILSALLAGALAFGLGATTGAAKTPSPPKPVKSPKPAKQPHPNKVTTTIVTTDNGCSGTPWATDTLRRTLKVHRNPDGSYRIREEDRGTFTTTGGVSPGNCPENKSKHGTAVAPGVSGKIKGYITGTVTNGTFNPNATCATVPCTQPLFVAAFFGPTAQFSCRTNSTDCKFDYKYHAHDQNLRYHKWRDRGHGAGTSLKEHFKGDIATT